MSLAAATMFLSGQMWLCLGFFLMTQPGSRSNGWWAGAIGLILCGGVLLSAMLDKSAVPRITEVCSEIPA